MALHDDGSISGQSGSRFLAFTAPSVRERRWAKRLFDIGAASASLILLSPIILITAVAVKIGSRGSIFAAKRCMDMAIGRFESLNFDRR